MNKPSIPTNKLLKNLEALSKQPSPHKKPVVLHHAGTYNPVHKKHVLNLEYAKKLIEEQEPDKKVVGGYLTPTIEKLLLEKLPRDKVVKDFHRMKMCELSVEDSDWIDVSKWLTKIEEMHPNVFRALPKIYEFQVFSIYFNDATFSKVGKEISQYELDDIEVIIVFGTDATIKFAKYLGPIFDQGFRLVVVKRDNVADWKKPVTEAFDKHLGRERWEKNVLFADSGAEVSEGSSLIRDLIKQKKWKELAKFLHPKVVEYAKNHDIFSEPKKEERERDKNWLKTLNMGRNWICGRSNDGRNIDLPD